MRASEELKIEELAAGVLSITLNRPHCLNAFSEENAIMLGEFFRTHCCADGVRLVLLQATGTHFCTGFDLKTKAKLAVEDGMAMMAATFRALYEIPVMTVALINGVAMGGGVGFVTACDYVVAMRQATFACPEARHGIMPAIVAPYVTGRIGSRRAMAMMATGAAVPAGLALRWGMVDEIVESSDELLRRRTQLIDDVLSTAPGVSRALKPLLRSMDGDDIDDELINATVKNSIKFRSMPEAKEGVEAFRDKRKPYWRAV